jgi:hypothetical protein
MYSINCMKMQTLDFSTTITKQSYTFVQPYKYPLAPGLLSVSRSRLPITFFHRRVQPFSHRHINLGLFTSKFSLRVTTMTFTARVSLAEPTTTLPPVVTS